MPPPDPRPTLDSPRLGSLTDVPEDSPLTPSARSPYFHHAVSGSATTFRQASASASTTSLGSAVPSRTSSAAGHRTPSAASASSRGAPSRSASGDASVVSGPALRRQRSGSPATVRARDRDRDRDRERDRDRDDRSVVGPRERDGRDGREGREGKGARPPYRVRNTPHLPSNKDAEPTPPTLMHWSRAPMYCQMLAHGIRAHTVTLIDNIAWLFGGCDEKSCWKDVFCFNTGACECHYAPRGVLGYSSVLVGVGLLEPRMLACPYSRQWKWQRFAMQTNGWHLCGERRVGRTHAFVHPTDACERRIDVLASPNIMY